MAKTIVYPVSADLSGLTGAAVRVDLELRRLDAAWAEPPRWRALDALAAFAVAHGLAEDIEDD